MIALALLACAGPPPLETGRPPACAAPVVVATTDYSVGALATVCHDDLAVDDTIAPLSGDPALAADDGWLVVLDRSGGDRLRVYDPGDFGAPALELALDPGSNPHGAAIVDGDLFVSLYGRAEIAVFDLADGARVGRVDLSAFADADGLPEPDELVGRGGLLYVALQALDRATWTSAGGHVVEIDPATREVTRSWETGPNPKIKPSAAGLVVLTGNHFVPDGALQRLDPDVGLGAPLFRESSLGLDLVDWAEGAGGAILVASDPDSQDYTLLCVDGEAIVGEAVLTSLVADVAVDAQGRAWLATRTNHGNAAPSRGGLELRDLTDCSLLATVETLLEPYALVLE